MAARDIDSFFAESGAKSFNWRMTVSTTDKWSRHTEEALVGQHVPVTRLRVQDLDESSIDWSQFSLRIPEVMQRKDKKVLRAHQRLALGRVREGFHAYSRGKLIMACGTGKTLTSLRITENLVPSGGSVLPHHGSTTTRDPAAEGVGRLTSALTETADAPHVQGTH